MFNIDISEKPEEKKSFIFDFSKILSVFHSMSMLSAKIPNSNINVGLTFKKQRLDAKKNQKR